MKTKNSSLNPKPDETMEDVIMDMEKRARPHDIFKNGEQFGTSIITGDDLMTYAERLRTARKRELETYENLRKITEENIRVNERPICFYSVPFYTRLSVFSWQPRSKSFPIRKKDKNASPQNRMIGESPSTNSCFFFPFSFGQSQ